MPQIPVRWKGQTRLSPAEQVALAVRVVDDKHWDDVKTRASARLGTRYSKLGPLDMSRNSLRSFVGRINRAHEIPPLVGGLSPVMARYMGDQSARATVDRYTAAGGHPMPTGQIQAAQDAARYRHAAGYSGIVLGWSDRAKQISLEAVSPDDLDVFHLSDDPTEPVVIYHRRRREISGKIQDVVDVYDLTDLGAPVFRVVTGTDGNKGRDVTDKAIRGEGLESGWPHQWRFTPNEEHPDGRPFHRIVITGTTRYPFATAGLVDATLNVCVGWTHFLAGISDAGHPQRNTVGMEPVGMDTDGETRQSGIEVGPETVMQWRHIDPERPGEHWQDGPGFDPEVTGRAMRDYEISAMNGLGLPISFEATGGEPTEQERIAMDIVIASTYPENRRVDSEVLRRVAAMLNRLPLADGVPEFSEAPYPTLYRAEIAEAITAAAAQKAADAEAAAREAESQAAHKAEMDAERKAGIKVEHETPDA